MRRFLFALAISWLSAATLAFLYAICPDGHFDSTILRLPAVVSVALFASITVTLVVLPFAYWAMRSGWRNVATFGPLLWLLLAAYIVFVLPRQSGLGFVYLLALAVGGVLTIGVIPARGGGLRRTKRSD